MKNLEGDSVYLRRRTLGQRKFNRKMAKTSTKLDHLQIGPFTIKKKLNFVISAMHEDLSSIPYFVITAYQNPETNEDIEGSSQFINQSYSYNR